MKKNKNISPTVFSVTKVLSGRVKSALICVLMAALLISGCSGKNTQNSSSKGTDSNTQNISSDKEASETQTSSSGKTGAADTEKNTEKPDPQEAPLEAVFFDVGKGDCILFTSGDSHVLLDAGYEETAGDIIQELQERGVDSLDVMIITHYDKDHVGGAAEIASVIPPDMIYLPDYDGEVKKSGDLISLIETKNLPSERVTSVQEFTAGAADFTVDPALVAYDPAEENDNDASLIVEVTCGDDQWLLPGDIDKEAIDLWLQTNKQEYDVLKYPHHGKKSSNAAEFISNVSPEIAVITDSTEDEAAKKVLKKLEKEEADVYRSSEDGTITITGNGTEEFDVSTEK